MPSGLDVVFSIVVLLFIALEIWALVDIWKSAATQERKIMWTLFTVFVNPIGAIVWFAYGKHANQ